MALFSRHNTEWASSPVVLPLKADKRLRRFHDTHTLATSPTARTLLSLYFLGWRQLPWQHYAYLAMSFSLFSLCSFLISSTTGPDIRPVVFSSCLPLVARASLPHPRKGTCNFRNNLAISAPFIRLATCFVNRLCAPAGD